MDPRTATFQDLIHRIRELHRFKDRAELAGRIGASLPLHRLSPPFYLQWPGRPDELLQALEQAGQGRAVTTLAHSAVRKLERHSVRTQEESNADTFGDALDPYHHLTCLLMHLHRSGSKKLLDELCPHMTEALPLRFQGGVRIWGCPMIDGPEYNARGWADDVLRALCEIKRFGTLTRLTAPVLEEDPELVSNHIHELLRLAGRPLAAAPSLRRFRHAGRTLADAMVDTCPLDFGHVRARIVALRASRAYFQRRRDLLNRYEEHLRSQPDFDEEDDYGFQLLKHEYSD